MDEKENGGQSRSATVLGILGDFACLLAFIVVVSGLIMLLAWAKSFMG